MAENNMQVLIEGFDPSKVQEVNNFDKDWKEVYGAHQNNSIIQAPIIGIEKLLDKPCAVVGVGNIRGFIPLEFTGALTFDSFGHDRTIRCVQSIEL